MCSQDLSTSCNNAVILSNCYKVVIHNLSTRCVRNRPVANLSTSCNSAVILSCCYKVVIHNLSTRCVRNRLAASLSTSCSNAVILSNCYIIYYDANIFYASKNLKEIETVMNEEFQNILKYCNANNCL